ncbi:zinc finger MYM-type protein 1-like [Salvia splendens]|uniref:zinc finger MYM-type protein 1-like n=1 Tax=Salvia splendens TaxID=180675 RepID=UPI001C26E4FC|nr:zinc finger MYM-type protein 1-like [Salvia splendens]
MDKFMKKRPRVSIGSSSANVEQEPQQLGNNVVVENNPDEIEIDKEKIKADPGLRDSMDSFDVNIRDRIRREYVAKGPCQPKSHDFPKKQYGKDKRAPGDEAFVSGGFSNWKKANERFRAHVGSTGSSHNKARIEYENFVNQKQSVTYIVSRVSSKQEKEYRIRLTATLDVIRFLLTQGLGFRGHDETSTSSSRGNFLELLYWYSLSNDEVGQVVLNNAPGNNQMIAPSIQKEIVNACAIETTLEIMKEHGDELFSIMVDESRDCSVKEQMTIVIRYVNKNGEIIERYLVLVHVKETSSKCLKMAI